MPLPRDLRDAALEQVQGFCDARIASTLRDEIRLEASVRGSSITISERRAPWAPEYGPEWSKLPVAQMRYGEDGLWSLFWADRNGRWLRYDSFEPKDDLDWALREIDLDPHACFWG